MSAKVLITRDTRQRASKKRENTECVIFDRCFFFFEYQRTAPVFADALSGSDAHLGRLGRFTRQRAERAAHFPFLAVSPRYDDAGGSLLVFYLSTARCRGDGLAEFFESIDSSKFSLQVSSARNTRPATISSAGSIAGRYRTHGRRGGRENVISSGHVSERE